MNNIFLIGIISISIVMCVLIFLFFIIYLQFIAYFYLLESVDQKYFYNRIYEAKYIIKEIKGLESKKFKLCSFEDSSTLNLTVNGVESKKQYSFNEFEKLPETNN